MCVNFAKITVELQGELMTPSLLNAAFLQKPHILNEDNTLCLPCLAYGAMAIKCQLLKCKYTFTHTEHKMTTVTAAHARRGLMSTSKTQDNTH